VNINSIAAAQSAVKLQALRTQLELKKQGKSQVPDNERPDSVSEMQEQFEKLQKDNALALLDGKLRAGKELSRQELEFLKREKPELYEEALEIGRERRQYKKMLETRRTKKDVRNLHLQNMNRLLTEAEAVKKTPGLDAEKKKGLLDKIVKRMAGLQDEYAKFTASDKYAQLPRDENHKKGVPGRKVKSDTIYIFTQNGQSACALPAVKKARIQLSGPLRKERPSVPQRTLDLKV